MGSKKQSVNQVRKERPWRKAGLVIAIVLMLVAIAKVCTVSFFDLGAISNITGEVNGDLAVASGMGKVCFVGALLMFAAAAYGFNLYRTDRYVAKNVIIFGIVALASGLITGLIAIVDGHNALDVASSFIGAAVAIGLTYCALKLAQ